MSSASNLQSGFSHMNTNHLIHYMRNMIDTTNLGLPMSNVFGSGNLSKNPNFNSFAVDKPVVPGFGAPNLMDVDGGRHFGTGTSVSNWTSTHISLLQQYTPRFPQEGIQKEMLAFVEQNAVGLHSGRKINYEIGSISEMNMKLVTPQFREDYGSHLNPDQLMQDYSFAGSFNTNTPAWRATVSSDMEVSIITNRRARCVDITRACISKYANKHDVLFDNVWIVYLRHKLGDGEEQGTNRLIYDTKMKKIVKDYSKKTDVKHPHFWQMHILVTESDGTPHPCIAIDDEVVGRFIRVGSIVDYEGMRHAVDRDDVLKARQALSGTHNLLKKHRDYLNILDTFPVIDIYLDPLS